MGAEGLGFLGSQAVHLLGLFGFLGDIHDPWDSGLHAVSQFVRFDHSFNLAVDANVGEEILIHGLHKVELATLALRAQDRVFYILDDV